MKIERVKLKNLNTIKYTPMTNDEFLILWESIKPKCQKDIDDINLFFKSGYNPEDESEGQMKSQNIIMEKKYKIAVLIGEFFNIPKNDYSFIMDYCISDLFSHIKNNNNK